MMFYVRKYNEIVISILIILATVFQFGSQQISLKVSDSKDLIFDQSIGTATGAGFIAANMSEVILARDLLEACRNKLSSSCLEQEESVKSSIDTSQKMRMMMLQQNKSLESAIQNYQNIKSRYEWKIFLLNGLFYLFMVVAFGLSLLNRPK